MNHIFENIKKVEAMADLCRKDTRNFIHMHHVGAEQWELDAFQPRLDDNHQAFTDVVRQLSLDNPAQMVLFIKAVKALGAVEALERIREGEEFSNWVNLGLESWINRINAEVTE